MRALRFAIAAALAAAPIAMAQTPQVGQRGAPPSAPAQPGGGRGRGAVQTMTMTSSAWPDGGAIPINYTQAGEEISPPLAWTNAPLGVVSFVLIAHDVDAGSGGGTDDLLHWMLWNIPPVSTSIPEHVPAVAQLPDGTRQIGATGPGYRGPGAPASGSRHHYVFELYALDTTVEVPPVGASPAQTRAAVMAAMAGHVRGKAAYIGLFKRP